MKICILGAGALGCAIGGVLTESGSEVHLINRSAEHVDAMNRNGLTLREAGTERTVRVRAATDCREIGLADLVIVLVKSFDTRKAIETAGSIISETTAILSLQNGLGNEEIIAEVAGKERVLGGRTYAGGVFLGPGKVISGTHGRHTVIGELDGTITARVTRIADEFNRAGLATTVSANIVGIMWDKLFVNVATGALSGITRLPYGGLYKVPEVMDCALAAVAEGIAVAKALGVKISIEDPAQAWFKASEGLPPDFKASMLQSLEKGSKTEIDFINGSVVRWGAKCHVPTPVNQALVAGIKGIEYRMAHDAVKA
jgi:2-dehydropantoate 2-reductase